MSNIGPLELVIVLLIVLVVLGPRRLPEIGRSLGSGMRQFKEGVANPGTDSANGSAETDEPAPSLGSGGRSEPVGSDRKG
jgi:sec-independent protein translocase protein TatA